MQIMAIVYHFKKDSIEWHYFTEGRKQLKLLCTYYVLQTFTHFKRNAPMT